VPVSVLPQGLHVPLAATLLELVLLECGAQHEFAAIAVVYVIIALRETAEDYDKAAAAAAVADSAGAPPFSTSAAATDQPAAAADQPTVAQGGQQLRLVSALVAPLLQLFPAVRLAVQQRSRQAGLLPAAAADGNDTRLLAAYGAVLLELLTATDRGDGGAEGTHSAQYVFCTTPAVNHVRWTLWIMLVTCWYHAGMLLVSCW
jgi:hypothetical protein